MEILIFQLRVGTWTLGAGLPNLNKSCTSERAISEFGTWRYTMKKTLSDTLREINFRFILCWLAFSPQIVGTLFATPPTWKKSVLQTDCAFGWPMANVIKSNLNKLFTDHICSVRFPMLLILPKLTDGFPLFDESVIESDGQCAGGWWID